MLQCDGCSLDLANGPSLEGIAVLNIPSMYGGSNLWGENPSQKKRKKAPKKDKDREPSSSSMSSMDLSFAIQGNVQGSGVKAGLSCWVKVRIKSGITRGGEGVIEVILSGAWPLRLPSEVMHWLRAVRPWSLEPRHFLIGCLGWRFGGSGLEI